MELLEKVRAMDSAGEKVVHMEIGEPDFTTPLSIREAGAGVAGPHSF
jgi:aspartate/methionine/tyrosine aminotransferase